MKFKAIEIGTKPFINWYSGTFADNDPLVLDEANIPAYQFGVCPLKIENGALAQRTTAEMDAFEAEWIQENKLRAQAQLADAMESETFMYGLDLFPMNRAAHLRYLAMENRRDLVTNLQAVDKIVGLPRTEVDAFMQAFYTKVINLTEPTL